MKIALCSDLHLEFGDIILKNTENADVLILSGDILIAEDLRRTAKFVGMTAEEMNIAGYQTTDRTDSAKRFRLFEQGKLRISACRIRCGQSRILSRKVESDNRSIASRVCQI